MSSFKSDFLRELEQRGFIHQQSDAGALDEIAATRVLTGYIGYDATAPSLHVGHLMQIMMLRWLQKTGN
ncbi:MAG: tyrosine--tRNA ligase, partial [Alphaproteobacteria bacterium]|nr:tyrosine--tRNA ligase [Alphaproteobacteria bacterium]MDX5414882.1 tyrosine--tRNA ligase [Alphaproteobacteria bacterium]MDX5492055.1 tyrosine--tRNA ligase [Alphaproteobacteria bacterium]